MQFTAKIISQVSKLFDCSLSNENYASKSWI